MSSRLRHIYQELRAQAVVTGSDQRRDLAKGARLIVRVQDDTETVTFARRGAPVGETEEATFKRHCGVPVGAERIPATGQQVRQDPRHWEWHLVAYRWRVAAEQPPLLPGSVE